MSNPLINPKRGPLVPLLRSKAILPRVPARRVKVKPTKTPRQGK